MMQKGILNIGKKQLNIANSVVKKENYLLPTVEQQKARNNRIKLCRQKIAELEG